LAPPAPWTSPQPQRPAAIDRCTDTGHAISRPSGGMNVRSPGRTIDPFTLPAPLAQLSSSSSFLVFASQRRWLAPVRSFLSCVSSDSPALARLFFFSGEAKSNLISHLPLHHSSKRPVTFDSSHHFHNPSDCRRHRPSLRNTRKSCLQPILFLFTHHNHTPWRGIGSTIATLAFQLLWPLLLP
jgi:hypothetical protein